MLRASRTLRHLRHSASETPQPAGWHYPTSIRFGAGRVAELGAACAELGISKPLLVTDPGILNAGTMVADAAAALDCPVYSDVRGNPTEANVTGGVEAFKAHGCDGVIAFGGGSAMDAAKCVALMVGQARPLMDFEDREDWHARVDEAGMAPCVAVPTTAGTGSEVGRAAVVTDEATKTKKIIFHANMLPGRVILDPALTTGLPADVTAWTGIDALAHSMEAFSSPSYHPQAAGIALEGMRLVKDYLPRAVADGNDLEARAQMLVASTMGAAAFQKGLGAMHSLTHAAGGLLDTQHGQTVAVVMPYVLEFNRPALADSFEALARYLDLPTQSVSGVVDWVLLLREQCGVPHTLGDLGVEEDHIAALAPLAVSDPSSGTNPIPLVEEDVAELYGDCVRGLL
mmetsp:Transcript_13488/g.40154  ORF Transcript_13488/g.40154 Transcript_13488/m.40154 type:complete len:400 (-) Transcript_13488:7-1206(-)